MITIWLNLAFISILNDELIAAQKKTVRWEGMVVLVELLQQSRQLNTFELEIYILPWLQTIFLPVVGLVDPDKLKPGDLVGVNKDSYLILDTLPSEYDSRVKAMEVDEKPTEDYNDIGGLEKQVYFDVWGCYA